MYKLSTELLLPFPLRREGGLLPLSQDTRLAVFGKAQIDYVKGGGGSGNVFCEYIKNIYDHGIIYPNTEI